MELTIPKFVTYCAAWFGIMTGIWALFDRAETVLRKEVKDQMTNWLKNDKSVNLSWPEIFIEIFDKVFGEKHFTRKCFLRSCYASVISVVIMSLIVFTHLWDKFFDGSMYVGERYLRVILISILSTFIFNVIPDYLSLLETRGILNWMRKSSILGRFVLLILDLIVTTLIYIISMAIGLSLVSFTSTDMTILDFFSLIRDSLKFIPLTIFEALTFWKAEEGHAILAIWLYPTYFTSIWIWLFFFSSIIIKTLYLSTSKLNKLKMVFNVEEKPLRTLGFIGMILVTIGFIIIPFL